MRTARVLSADALPNMPDQDVGAEPVIRVFTDLSAGQNNAFYMDPADFDGKPLKLPVSNQPDDALVDPDCLNRGDLVLFDVWDGPFHKRVSTKGRGFRQRGNSFDVLATPSDPS